MRTLSILALTTFASACADTVSGAWATCESSCTYVHKEGTLFADGGDVFHLKVDLLQRIEDAGYCRDLEEGSARWSFENDRLTIEGEGLNKTYATTRDDDAMTLASGREFFLLRRLDEGNSRGDCF